VNPEQALLIFQFLNAYIFPGYRLVEVIILQAVVIKIQHPEVGRNNVPFFGKG
jgi:hypothetical protein